MAEETGKLIRIKALEFGNAPFRKLRDLKIEFAGRFTLIAGHNGIGKSTMLGLIANTFGLTDGPKSYFGENFYANIERIVYLSVAEVVKAQENPASAPTVEADVRGIRVRKRCSMTKRGKWKRARVVPRTIEKVDGDPVGPDAKVPLPTIYLGIKRLASIGEAEERDVSSSIPEMDDSDKKLIAEFVRSVILGSQVTTDITYQSIKGARKKTAQPGYVHHDAQAVSLGQDSLGSIATALASFSRLKRDLADNYPGGLLVIDELDAGFHPHAIDRLIKELKAQAKRLDLQIIATTHSPRLIEAIHPTGGGDANAPDAVIYLLDTQRPRRAENESLTAILNDMALRQDQVDDQKKPTLGVYFEDAEGAQFFEALVPSALRSRLSKKHGVRIKLIPLGVGGSNLVKLPEHDPIFRDRVLIVDADTSVPKKAKERGNVLKLPCPSGSHGTDRSPENVIKKFLREMSNASEGPLYEAMLRLKTTNPSSDKLRSTFFADNDGHSNQRDSSKKWWVKHWKTLRAWGVVSEWAALNGGEVNNFISAFDAAVEKTVARLS